MLIEFSVGNFRSFKDPVTLSMVAAKIKARNKQLNQNNIFQSKNIQLLKSAALYGANASGKSNLFRAFAFMKHFVLSSTESNSEDTIDVEPFLLNVATRAQPSYFEAVFVINGIRYRYGFEASEHDIHSEWLFRTNKREAELFWREHSSIEIKSGFKEGKGLEHRTRSNVLFLSVVDQWNGEIAKSIITWFKQAGIISGIQDKAYLGFTVDKFVDDLSMRKKIQEYMQQMDLGVSSIAAERLPGIPKELQDAIKRMDESEIPQEIREALDDNDQWFTASVKLRHPQFDESGLRVQEIEFDFETQESEGTKKAFALSGPIIHTLAEGLVLFVDELDARLHPLMTKHIIQLFNSTKTNPHNAQLIFATHDTNLLDRNCFRRDQIWFAEKDRFGNSDLYSLVEYKRTNTVRNDASYEADYIAGKYGAIPFIGNISFLIEDQNGEA